MDSTAEAELPDLVCTAVKQNLSMEEWRLFVCEQTPYQRTCPNLPPGPGAR